MIDRGGRKKMNENTLQDEKILAQDRLIEKQNQEIKRLWKLIGYYKRFNTDNIEQVKNMISTIKERKND